MALEAREGIANVFSTQYTLGSVPNLSVYQHV